MNAADMDYQKLSEMNRMMQAKASMLSFLLMAGTTSMTSDATAKMLDIHIRGTSWPCPSIPA